MLSWYTSKLNEQAGEDSIFQHITVGVAQYTDSIFKNAKGAAVDHHVGKNEY